MKKKTSGFSHFYWPNNRNLRITKLTILFFLLAVTQISAASFVTRTNRLEENRTTIKVEKVKVQFGNQLLDIRGKVVDEKGKPIAGASVKVKGTAMAVQTNNEGEFSFKNISNANILVISYVGFDTKEVLASSANMTIRLTASNTDLNEVVVVAFGTQKKANLTGAVDQITSKNLVDRPVATLGDALQGLMANLNVTTNGGGGAPGATKSINVRGFTGMSSLAGPLILVDGVETDINNVNVNDIESISLLKDIASTAIYGSRAPNGVLLITTKQGTKNQDARFSYNNNFSYAQPLNAPTMSNSLVWANTINEAYTNAGLAPYIGDAVLQRIKNYIANPATTPNTIPTLGGNRWASYDPDFGNANNDWFKIFLKDWAASSSHNLSIDGGGDKVSYFVGLGTSNRTGMYRYASDGYDRKNVRANINATINKYLSFSLKTSFEQENNNYPFNGGGTTGGNWFHEIARIWPIVPLIAPNGGYEDASRVPLNENGGRNIEKQDLARINADITFKPFDGFSLTGRYNYDFNDSNGSYSVLPYKYSTPQNPEVLSTTTSSISKRHTSVSYYVYNVFANYEKQLGDHYFKAQAGFQTEKRTISNLNGSNINLFNPLQPSLSLTYGDARSVSDPSSAFATNTNMGRINYNYKEKYLAEGNVSYMGTSLYPEDTRYNWFSSGSVGWVLSKENFFKSLLNTFSNVKFRASYGGSGDVSGSIGSGDYYPYFSNLVTAAPTSSSWIFNPASGAREPFVRQPGLLISPTLSWAKPSMLNIGADINFLTHFSLTFDWYRRNITHQYTNSRDYPTTLGISAPTVNAAASVTKGFDFTLGWNRTFDNQLNLNARLNVGRYTGVITQNDGNSTNSINSNYVGRPIGAIWGFETVGKFQSPQQITSSPSQSEISGATWQPGDIQYADLNNDGKIGYGRQNLADPGDQKIIGNSIPDFTYGFNLGANWKGIDLSVFVQGIGHADYAPNSNYFWGIAGGLYQSTVTPKLEDRWTPTNTAGYFPRIDINNGGRNQITQSGYLLNRAYMRVKNAQIGYTFADKLTKKYHVSGLRLYLSADNLFTISGVFKHQYVDPELLQSDQKIYPLQRTFSFGVRVNIQ